MTQFFVDEERESGGNRSHWVWGQRQNIVLYSYIEIKASRDFDVEMYMIQCTLHIVLKIYTINKARWSLFIHEIADTHITNNKKVFPNIIPQK